MLRQQVLERLVLQELQMQRANRAGIKVSDETLNNALPDVAEQNNIKLRELPAALDPQGIDYATTATARARNWPCRSCVSAT